MADASASQESSIGKNLSDGSPITVQNRVEDDGNVIDNIMSQQAETLDETFPRKSKYLNTGLHGLTLPHGREKVPGFMPSVSLSEPLDRDFMSIDNAINTSVVSSVTNVFDNSVLSVWCMCVWMQRGTLGRDLMRERTRSRIQYGGRQMRRVNTVLFLQFCQCFADTTRYLCDAIMLTKPSMVRSWATGITPLDVAIVVVNFARMNTVNLCWMRERIKQDVRTSLLMRERTYIVRWDSY